HAGERVGARVGGGEGVVGRQNDAGAVVRRRERDRADVVGRHLVELVVGGDGHAERRAGRDGPRGRRGGGAQAGDVVGHLDRRAAVEGAVGRVRGGQRLVAGRPQGDGEGVQPAIAGREGVVGRQGGGRVGARDVDRAGVVGDQVVVGVAGR